MTSVTTERLTKTAVHQALRQLLAEYQSEKEESQQDNDTHFTEYWESACRTIYEVATALHIPLEDPWVDPSWVRSAEYQHYLRKKRKSKRREPNQSPKDLAGA